MQKTSHGEMPADRTEWRRTPGGSMKPLFPTFRSWSSGFAKRLTGGTTGDSSCDLTPRRGGTRRLLFLLAAIPASVWPIGFLAMAGCTFANLLFGFDGYGRMSTIPQQVGLTRRFPIICRKTRTSCHIPNEITTRPEQISLTTVRRYLEWTCGP